MANKVFLESREFSAWAIEDMIAYYNQSVAAYGKESVFVDWDLGIDYECAYCNFTVTVKRDETDKEKADRIAREKETRRILREKNKKDKEAREAKEREQYEKLKAKYG